MALGLKPWEDWGWGEEQDGQRIRGRFVSVQTVILLFIPTDSGLTPSDTRAHHSLSEARGLCSGKESCPPSTHTPPASTPQVADGANTNVWCLKLEFVTAI